MLSSRSSSSSLSGRTSTLSHRGGVDTHPETQDICKSVKNAESVGNICTHTLLELDNYRALLLVETLDKHINRVRAHLPHVSAEQSKLQCTKARSEIHVLELIREALGDAKDALQEAEAPAKKFLKAYREAGRPQRLPQRVSYLTPWITDKETFDKAAATRFNEFIASLSTLQPLLAKISVNLKVFTGRPNTFLAQRFNVNLPALYGNAFATQKGVVDQKFQGLQQAMNQFWSAQKAKLEQEYVTIVENYRNIRSADDRISEGRAFDTDKTFLRKITGQASGAITPRLINDQLDKMSQRKRAIGEELANDAKRCASLTVLLKDLGNHSHRKELQASYFSVNDDFKTWAKPVLAAMCQGHT